MSEQQFQEEVLRELREIQKKQQAIIDIVSKTIDVAIGNDVFCVDEVPFVEKR